MRVPAAPHCPHCRFTIVGLSQMKPHAGSYTQRGKESWKKEVDHSRLVGELTSKAFLGGTQNE